jgi:hypothetical protein
MAARIPRRRAATVPIEQRLEPEARQFASCRALGHTWRHQAPISNLDGVQFVSHCEDCAAERTKTITRSGTYKASYRYQQGYSRHGEETLTTVEWRRVLVVSALEGWQ